MTDHKPIGYSVKPPENYKKLKKRARRLILTYVALCILPFVLAYTLTRSAEVLLYMIIPVAVLCFVTVRITWTKTKPEYDYTVEAGDLTLAAVYGGRMRRELDVIVLSGAELIAPKNGVYDGRVRDFAPQKTVNGVFTDEQSNYFILYRDASDTPSIAHIYADEETVKVLRACCPKTYLR